LLLGSWIASRSLGAGGLERGLVDLVLSHPVAANLPDWMSAKTRFISALVSKSRGASGDLFAVFGRVEIEVFVLAMPHAAHAMHAHGAVFAGVKVIPWSEFKSIADVAKRAAMRLWIRSGICPEFEPQAQISGISYVKYKIRILQNLSIINMMMFGIMLA
jgi:hypothetical protein